MVVFGHVGLWATINPHHSLWGISSVLIYPYTEILCITVRKDLPKRRK